MTRPGGLLENMTKLQSQTFSGAWSTLTDNVDALRVALGTPINAAILPVMEHISATADAIPRWTFTTCMKAVSWKPTALPPSSSPLPSREQVELRQHVKGLALYTSTAETERFNFANPPEENLQLYHRRLPYAVALGLEAAWGKRFAHQLAQALASEEAYTEALTQDLVYSSRVSLSSYRDAVCAEQAAKAAASPRGGSSFSGFGGGAGSGGGGGGGRAC